MLAGQILPNFLIREFASRVTDDEIFTIIYCKQAQPFEVNIIDVCDQTVSDGAVQELICTGLAEKFATLLYRLRMVTDGSEVWDENILALITHLHTRIERFRMAVRDSAAFLLEKLSEYILQEDNIKTFILDNPQWIKEQFEEITRHNPAFKLYKEMLLQLPTSQILMLLDKYRVTIKTQLQTYLTNHKQRMLKVLNETDKQRMANGEAAVRYMAEYQKLRWFVYQSEEPLILADVGYILQTTKGYKSLNEEHDPIKNLFLPLTSEHILVGTSLDNLPSLDFKFINAEMAKCSREFFICRENSAAKSVLIPTISNQFHLVQREELEELLKKLVRETFIQAIFNGEMKFKTNGYTW
jgi:hypothetical protein